MGKTFTNLTWNDLCDLMCGGVEKDGEEFTEERNKADRRSKEHITTGTKLSKRPKKKYRNDGGQ